MFNEIEKGKWWDHAWSLVTGCSEVSSGCDGCWERDVTERLSNRILFLPQYKDLLSPEGKWNGRVRMNFDLIDKPRPTQKGAVWAIWTDLFHPGVSKEFQTLAFMHMALCKNHIFVICTKRIRTAYAHINEIKLRLYCEHSYTSSDCSYEDYLKNVIIMTSAEDQGTYDFRLMWLLRVPLVNKALSLEPLLKPIDLHLSKPLQNYDITKAHADNRVVGDKIAWVVDGGETSNCHYKDARPADPSWFKSIQNQCDLHAIPYLHKANGEWIREASGLKHVSKKKAGRSIYGVTYNGIPKQIVRELNTVSHVRSKDYEQVTGV